MLIGTFYIHSYFRLLVNDIDRWRLGAILGFMWRKSFSCQVGLDLIDHNGVMFSDVFEMSFGVVNEFGICRLHSLKLIISKVHLANLESF